MAQIEMSNARTPHIKNTYQTADFYFGDAYDNANECGLSIRKVHQADLQQPYLGICFQINHLSFVKDDIRYTLLENINGATPLTATPMKNEDIVAHEGQYSIAFNDSLFTAMPIGIKPDDFDEKENGVTFLSDSGRRRFLQEWQERKREAIVHPFLEEKIVWGLVPYAQSLLLARTIRGDLDEYPAFLWK